MLAYIRNTIKETKTLEIQCTGKAMVIHRDVCESMGPEHDTTVME